MPLYEYTCNRCKSEFELLVRSTGQKVKCPDCNSGKIEKKFSLFGMKSGGKGGSSSGGASCSSCQSTSCKSCNH